MTDVAKLRRLAASERRSQVEYRVRRGADPAEVFAELPEIDDYVLEMLRDEVLESRGLASEYSMARYLQHDQRPDAADLKRRADRVDAEIFRELGLKHPELIRAVWRALHNVLEDDELDERDRIGR